MGGSQEDGAAEADISYVILKTLIEKAEKVLAGSGGAPTGDVTLSFSSNELSAAVMADIALRSEIKKPLAAIDRAPHVPARAQGHHPAGRPGDPAAGHDHPAQVARQDQALHPGGFQAARRALPRETLPGPRDDWSTPSWRWTESPAPFFWCWIIFRSGASNSSTATSPIEGM